MYTKPELRKMLLKDLKTELDTVYDYMSNLWKIDYSKNENLIHILVLGSMNHARHLLTILFEMSKENKGKQAQKFKDFIIKEELGMREMYKYQIKKIKDPEIKKALTKIMEDEVWHEKFSNKLEF